MIGYCSSDTRIIAAAFAAAMCLAASCAFGAPHIPVNAEEVVEQLPPSFLALQRIVPSATKAESLKEALATAHRYIEIGQTYSDPRAYGYAQAALGKWWSADPAPPEVLVMRARILQFRHEFDAALAQLEPALRSDQFDPDAWLLLASISQVRGNVRAARAACLKLIPISDPLIGATCAASTAALAGNAANAESLLRNALSQASAASSPELTWAWTILGEIRGYAGDDAEARNAFEQALRISPQDVYARSAYADVLLDDGDTRKARTILGGDPGRADALLLRAAIAANREKDADAPSLRDRLAQRFAEARARGDETHLREQARFALEVENDPAKALDLAQRNFKVQREPADVRILLESAHAAGDISAAQPAIDWLKETGMRSQRLQRLVEASGRRDPR